LNAEEKMQGGEHTSTNIFKKALNFYVKELKELGFTEITNKSWKNLPLEKKEKYINEVVKSEFAGMKKKQDLHSYDNSLTKSVVRTKTPFDYFVLAQEKNKQDIFLKWCQNEWDKLDDSARSKYQEMANSASNNDFHIDAAEIPKMPLKPYNRYVRDRIPKLKEIYPGREILELFGIVAEE
jgi:hypothetical protein